MAGQGRVSAVMFGLVLSYLAMTEAANIKVGDAAGWTFNVVKWPKGKTFRAGDTLEFNYRPGAHNVVVVNNVGFQKCITSKNAKVYTSGNDKIKLAKGPNYFICSFPGHCEGGMKIYVNAL